jgi:hypothetical protein
MSDLGRKAALAAKFVCNLRGGSQPILVEASDGLLYVAKFTDNLQGPNLPFNESIGSELYRACGLAVPLWKPLLVTDDFLDQNPGCWLQTAAGRLRPDSVPATLVEMELGCSKSFLGRVSAGSGTAWISGLHGSSTYAQGMLTTGKRSLLRIQKAGWMRSLSIADTSSAVPKGDIDCTSLHPVILTRASTKMYLRKIFFVFRGP